MLILLDALFALLLYKLFGTPALYILGITCAVMFLRTWGNVSFVARVYADIIRNKILMELEETENNENEKF
mgnify:FL=1